MISDTRNDFLGPNRPPTSRPKSQMVRDLTPFVHTIQGVINLHSSGFSFPDIPLFFLSPQRELTKDLEIQFESKWRWKRRWLIEMERVLELDWISRTYVRLRFIKDIKITDETVFDCLQEKGENIYCLNV